MSKLRLDAAPVSRASRMPPTATAIPTRMAIIATSSVSPPSSVRRSCHAVTTAADSLRMVSVIGSGPFRWAGHRSGREVEDGDDRRVAEEDEEPEHEQDAREAHALGRGGGGHLGVGADALADGAGLGGDRRPHRGPLLAGEGDGAR